MTSTQQPGTAARTTTPSRDSSLESLAEESARLVDDARDLGRRAVSTAGHAVQGLRDEGRAALASGRDKAVQAKGRFDDMVGDNPTKSLLIALGVGAVLGFAFGRARR